MLRAFYTYFWVVWFAMLVIGDPIATWLGHRDHVGDAYTDTHFISTHISLGVRAAIVGWLIYHFFVQHKTG